MEFTSWRDNAVSPVVAVVLLLAIVVLLSAVIGFLVIDLGNTSPGKSTSTGQAGVRMTETQTGAIESQLVSLGRSDYVLIDSGIGEPARLNNTGETVSLFPTGERITIIGVRDGVQTVVQTYDPPIGPRGDIARDGDHILVTNGGTTVDWFETEIVIYIGGERLVFYPTTTHQFTLVSGNERYTNVTLQRITETGNTYRSDEPLVFNFSDVSGYTSGPVRVWIGSGGTTATAIGSSSAAATPANSDQIHTIENSTTEAPYDIGLPEEITVTQGEPLTLEADVTLTTGHVESYKWDLGDGTHRDTATVTHTYSTVGTYRISVQTTTDDGRQAGDTAIVTVVEGESAPPESTAELSFNNRSTSLVDDGWTGYAGFSKENYPTYAGGGSLEFGTDSNHQELAYTFETPATYSGVEFYIHPAPYVHNEVIFEDTDGTNMGALFFKSAGTTGDHVGIYWSTANGDDTSANRGNGVMLSDTATEGWYKVEYKNIDYDAETLDIYLNDELVKGDAKFYHGATNIGGIRLSSNSKNPADTGWLDEVDLKE